MSDRFVLSEEEFNRTAAAPTNAACPRCGGTQPSCCNCPNNPPQPVDVAGVPELKPCPFCGSTKVENWASRPRDREHDVWCVFCHDCLCEGPETLNEAEAAAEWNQRATQPAITPNGSMSTEQLQRADLLAESRRIDVATAQELVYLRDRAATPPDVTERARRAAKALNEQGFTTNFAGVWAIIAAEFKRGE